MFFRFGVTIGLIVAVSLAGIAIEKRTLALQRSVSLQHYRGEQLEEQRIRLRLRCEELGAPLRLLEEVESGRLRLKVSNRPENAKR